LGIIVAGCSLPSRLNGLHVENTGDLLGDGVELLGCRAGRHETADRREGGSGGAVFGRDVLEAAEVSPDPEGIFDYCSGLPKVGFAARGPQQVLEQGAGSRHEINALYGRLMRASGYEAVDVLGFSSRACHSVIRVARTIADLENEPEILRHHLAEAISLRSFDRDYSRTI